MSESESFWLAISSPYPHLRHLCIGTTVHSPLQGDWRTFWRPDILMSESASFWLAMIFSSSTLFIRSSNSASSSSLHTTLNTHVHCTQCPGSGDNLRTDPDPWICSVHWNLDPALFVSDFQNSNKKKASLLLTVGTLTSVFKDTKSLRSYKTMKWRIF